MLLLRGNERLSALSAFRVAEGAALDWGAAARRQPMVMDNWSYGVRARLWKTLSLVTL